MNYYEKIIRKGTMAADEYKKKEVTPIDELDVTDEELEKMDLDAIIIIEDMGDPFNPVIK